MQALTIAAYIIRQCEDKNRPVNNLKLQNMLYYIQMLHLKKYGFPAFDAPIEAWRHGAVVYDIYLRFKRYTSNPIHLDDIYVQQTTERLTQDCKQICDEIIPKTLALDPWALVGLTCQTEAWQKNFVKGYYNVIPLREMQECKMNL
jgi:uncharacterized phage-associated protein